MILSIAFAINDIGYFHTGMFERNRDAGLYEVSIGLGDEDLILSAFGYFNKDK